MTQLRWPSAATSHSFDNDSSIDIVGEQLGLLRGAAAESLLGAVNLRTIDSSFSAADTDAET